MIWVLKLINYRVLEVKGNMTKQTRGASTLFQDYNAFDFNIENLKSDSNFFGLSNNNSNKWLQSLKMNKNHLIKKMIF